MKSTVDHLVDALRGCFSEQELRQVADTLEESYGTLPGPSKLLDVLEENITGAALHDALTEQVGLREMRP